MKYRKKPAIIDAIQWTGGNLFDVITFTDRKPDIRGTHAGMKWDEYCDLVERDGLKIFTLEGKMSASIGDYIIRGVKGEYYPCKPDIFALTYEAAPTAPAQPHWIDVPQEALCGRTARKGYAANPVYAAPAPHMPPASMPELPPPAINLHDDGHFTWRNGGPHKSNYAEWKGCAFTADQVYEAILADRTAAPAQPVPVIDSMSHATKLKMESPLQKSMRACGVVMTDGGGKRAVIDMGKVNWADAQPNPANHIGYFNTKHGTFFRQSELDATAKNDEAELISKLLASGEIIKVYSGGAQPVPDPQPSMSMFARKADYEAACAALSSANHIADVGEMPDSAADCKGCALIRNWAQAAWTRGHAAGVYVSRSSAQHLTDALDRERAAHLETNRMMTEALTQAEDAALPSADSLDAARLDWLTAKVPCDDLGFDLPFSQKPDTHYANYRNAIDAAMTKGVKS